MISNVNNQINNLPELIILLILPFTFLILVTKINLILIMNYQKKSHKKDLLEETNLIYKKVLLITFQILIIILNQKVNNIFWTQLMPFLSLILFLQFIISCNFLVKNNKKNKIPNNTSSFSFMILIAIIFIQFLVISWKIHNLLFTNINNFIAITMIYSVFILFIYKLFNQNFLVIKYLITETYQILVNKKNDKLIKVKKSLTIAPKPIAVANLWEFVHWKTNQTDELNKINKNKKTIKEQFILFVIACLNLTNKNITKLQKIIINGWKTSLIE